MNTVTLGEICNFKYGSALPGQNRIPGDVPVYGSNGQVGFHSVPLTNGPTIVVGRKGSVGKISYSDRSCWPIDTSYFIDASCTDQDLRWLAYAIDSLGLDRLNKATGVPGLNRNDAYERTVLVPPLAEQQRIAAMLGQGDALRRKRREALRQLERLETSTFEAICGDPVENSKGWPDQVQLGEVADIASGITKGRKLAGKLTRLVPYLAVANVQDRVLVLDNVKTIEATESEIERYRLRRGDLLLTEGGDPDKLGRGALWEEEIPEAIHQNHIFRVRLKSNAFHPVYLNWLVGSLRGKRYFLRQAKQTTGIASINMGQLKSFPLLAPPLDVQHAFADAIKGIGRQKRVQGKHLVQLNLLFASIQHRAFQGAL